MDDAEFWNRMANRYSRQPVANPDAFERKIEVTRSLITPQSVVIDIGCGTGSLALRLAQGAAEVHGLDFSTEMVRIAEAKARHLQVGNAHFHAGPFDESFDAFGDGQLDGVCAYSLLHLLPERSLALQRIHQLLKPGGFFVSSTVCLGESRIPFRPMLSVMRWLGKAPSVVRLLTRRELVDDIRQAGFIDISQPEVGASRAVGFIVAKKPG
ncbi:MAG: class I SAM-dependent methyltransferase [Luteimonas sp.]